MDQIIADSMAPVHVRPERLVRIELIEKVVLPSEEN